MSVDSLPLQPPALAGRPARPGPGRGPAGPAGRHPRPSARPRAARLVALTSGFVSLFLEVEAGRRPRAHLKPVMTPMLYARLSEIWVRGGEPGNVVSVRVLSRNEASCDLIAVVRRGTRWGAVGVNLQRSGDRWVVAVIARPEDRELPPPPYPVPADDPDEPDDVLPPVVLRAYQSARTDCVQAAQYG